MGKNMSIQDLVRILLEIEKFYEDTPITEMRDFVIEIGNLKIDLFSFDSKKWLRQLQAEKERTEKRLSKINNRLVKFSK